MKCEALYVDELGHHHVCDRDAPHPVPHQREVRAFGSQDVIRRITWDRDMGPSKHHSATQDGT